MLQLTFLQEHKAQFFHLGLNQNPSTCEKNLLWKMGGFVSCVTIQSPWSENSEKYHHYWYISIFKLKFLSNSRFEFINQNLNWKPYSCRGGFDWKSIDIDPCIEILIVQNFQKVVTKNDRSRVSNCFSITTGLISFMRVTISKLTLGEKDSIQISVSWFVASKSGCSQKSKVYILTHVDIQSQNSTQLKA